MNTNKYQHSRSIITLLLTIGFIAISVHPVIHAASLQHNIHGAEHESEIPYSEGDECLQCLLAHSVSADFSDGLSLYNLTDFTVVFNEIDTIRFSPLILGFSLRSPPFSA